MRDEDKFTNTPEDAAVFERLRAQEAGDRAMTRRLVSEANADDYLTPAEQEAADRDHDERIDVAGEYVPPTPRLGDGRA
jgi:hypothetical protein